MGYIFDGVTWTAGFAALFLEALCIACGLYVASEIAEENAVPIRRFLKRSIIGAIILHILLYFDGIPVLQSLGGICCHASLAPLLINFPFVEPISLPSILACVSVVINHIIWFKYFTTVYVSLKNMLGFFIVFVWGLPLCFFVSMTVADDALPSISSPGGSRKNVGICKRLMDSIFPRKEDMLHNITPGRGKHY